MGLNGIVDNDIIGDNDNSKNGSDSFASVGYCGFGHNPKCGMVFS